MSMLRLSAVFVLSAVLLSCAGPFFGPSVPRISVDELRAVLGNPSVVVLDVRTGGEWTGTDRKIAGAIRPDMTKDASSWAMDLPRDKQYVLYCS